MKGIFNFLLNIKDTPKDEELCNYISSAMREYYNHTHLIIVDKIILHFGDQFCLDRDAIYISVNFRNKRDNGTDEIIRTEIVEIDKNDKIEILDDFKFYLDIIKTYYRKYKISIIK